MPYAKNVSGIIQHNIPCRKMKQKGQINNQSVDVLEVVRVSTVVMNSSFREFEEVSPPQKRHEYERVRVVGGSVIGFVLAVSQEYIIGLFQLLLTYL